MTRARISIVVIAVAMLAIGSYCLAGISFFRPNTVSIHRYTRQVILHYIFSRADHPFIVLGDSITEASTLPRSTCDHALVNAGLDGASTASDLGTWLIEVLEGRRAGAIVVALGTNDALQGREQKEFEANYARLLAQLKGSADHLVVLGIPSSRCAGACRRNIRPNHEPHRCL